MFIRYIIYELVPIFLNQKGGGAMSDVSRELIETYAEHLRQEWLEAREIVFAHWQDFGEGYGAARREQHTKALKYAMRMENVVREMLHLPLYMGNEAHRTDYIYLEEVLVRNIAHICRLDADTGVPLIKLFFKSGSRSFAASLQLRLKSSWARFGFMMDDGRRTPS